MDFEFQSMYHDRLDPGNKDLPNRSVMALQDNHTSRSLQLQLYIIQAVTLTIEAPITVLVNFLVLVTVKYQKAFHTPDNYVLASLATTGLIFGLIYTPLAVISRLPGLNDLIRSHRIPCFLWWSFGVLGMCCPLANLCLLAAERFIAVNWPFQYPVWVTTKRIFVAIGFTWVLQLGTSSLPFFLGKNFEEVANPILKCQFYFGMPSWFNHYMLFSMVYVYLVVGLVLTTQVTIVCFRQAREFKRTTQFFARSADKHKFSSRVASVKLTAATMYLYLFMWIPNCVLKNIRPNSFESIRHLSIAHCVALLLLYSNFMINPLVYAFCRPSFRRAFKFVLTTAPSRWSELRYVEAREAIFDSTTSKPEELSQSRKVSGRDRPLGSTTDVEAKHSDRVTSPAPEPFGEERKLVQLN